jgi:uncharacterized protein
MATTIGKAEALAFLVGHLGLRRTGDLGGSEGPGSVLRQLGCIQLDPLDRVGTNADLVVQARVDGVCRGDVYRELPAGRAFEHFAKERCLLPASAFPHYRAEHRRSDWWEYRNALDAPADEALESVLAELAERGPIRPRDLADRGRAVARKMPAGTRTPTLSKAAVSVLWARCQVVVRRRTGSGKLYDLPERLLGEQATAEPGEPWARWALRHRVHAAGLLTVNAGPQWSMIRDVRGGDLPGRMCDEGELELVQVEGSPRRYLAPAGFRDASFEADDGRMRILGPLDPLVWDRKLIQHIADFDYIWEVYKPASRRLWGYYVCPLLHRGRFVGRFEGRRREQGIEVIGLWKQEGERFDDRAWERALSRLEELQ